MKKLLTSLVLGLALLAGCAAPVATPTVEQVALERQVVRKLVGSFGSCTMVMLADGLALTAKHCQDMLDPAVVVKADENDDLLLIKTEEKCPCIHLGVESPKVDSFIMIVGYPYGYVQFVTTGVVQGYMTYEGKNYMMTEAPAAPGVSGGGVFAYQGGKLVLVGVLVAGAPTGNVNLVVPFEEVKEFLKAYLKDGAVQRP